MELNDNKIDVTRDKVVNETTVKKTHLNSEIEFFITHTPKGSSAMNGVQRLLCRFYFKDYKLLPPQNSA